MKTLFEIQYDENTQNIIMKEVRCNKTLNWSSERYDMEIVRSLIGALEIKLDTTDLSDMQKVILINELLEVLDKYTENLDIL